MTPSTRSQCFQVLAPAFKVVEARLNVELGLASPGPAKSKVDVSLYLRRSSRLRCAPPPGAGRQEIPFEIPSRSAFATLTYGGGGTVLQTLLEGSLSDKSQKARRVLDQFKSDEWKSSLVWVVLAPSNGQASLALTERLDRLAFLCHAANGAIDRKRLKREKQNGTGLGSPGLRREDLAPQVRLGYRPAYLWIDPLKGRFNGSRASWGGGGGAWLKDGLSGLGDSLSALGIWEVLEALWDPSPLISQRVNTALWWLERAWTDPSAPSALVKLCTAFEALFTLNVSEHVTSVVRERFARLLGHNSGEQRVLWNWMDQLYDARCDLVHARTKRINVLEYDGFDRSPGTRRVREDLLAEGLYLALLSTLSMARDLPERFAGISSQQDCIRQFFDDRRWGPPRPALKRPFSKSRINHALRRLRSITEAPNR